MRAAVPLLLARCSARAIRATRKNIVGAFDSVLKQGCDGIEFDVRRTKCGNAVVCVSAKVGTKAISQLTRAELPGLPLLEDALRRNGDRLFLDIELKVPGLEPRVVAALRHRPPQSYVVSSASPAVIMELKARSGFVSVGIICSKPRQLMAWRALPVEYVMVHAELLTRRLIQLVHSAGKRVFAWAVNDKNSMLRLANWGVDGIISDDTHLLVQTLGRARPVRSVA